MPQGSVAGPTSMMENGMEVMWLNIFSAKLGCALVRPNLSVFEEAQRLETPSATMGTGLASPVEENAIFLQTTEQSPRTHRDEALN